MTNQTKNIILTVLLAVAFFLTIIWGAKNCTKTPEEKIIVKVDTLVIHDTIKVTQAITITKKVVDSIYVPVRDTIRQNDTLYVTLEREQLRWEDSLSVIYASGVQPRIDSVFHFTETMVITKEIPVKVKSHWGLGVQAGYGIGKGGFSPYVGVGVSYNILSW